MHIRIKSKLPLEPACRRAR